MKKSQTGRNKSIVIWRVRLLQLALTSLLVAVIGKTLYLQTYEASVLKDKSSKQRLKTHSAKTFRGRIVDRNGIVLAVDTARFDLYLRPKYYRSTTQANESLCKILDIRPTALALLLEKGKIIRLRKSLDREKADKIAKLRIGGLDLIPINQREYPLGTLAAHLLGFVNWNSEGQGGVEQALEDELVADEEDQAASPLRGDGRPIPHLRQMRPIINSSFGNQVVLTIDSKIQYKVERILAEGSKRAEAQRATAIVMSPKTGELLAWANHPGFDPNKFTESDPRLMNNWSVSEVYEPGSTFKILTVAAALEQKVIDANFRYYDTGELRLGEDQVVHNPIHDGPNIAAELGVVELFRQSSNTMAAVIGLKMKPQDFHRQLVAFGIGSKTGVEIPGESPGLLAKPEEWSLDKQATTSFGQGAVAVTPIQLAAAVASLANRGEWVQPHIIFKIKSADGSSTIKDVKPIRRRAISKEVAAQVTDMLATSIRLNLEGSTGYVAGDIPGYHVAGKTGTSQKYCPDLATYCPNKTIASFVGYFPSEDPEFLVFVMVDSPQKLGGWGNTVAGPIFNSIGQMLMKDYY